MGIMRFVLLLDGILDFPWPSLLSIYEVFNQFVTEIKDTQKLSLSHSAFVSWETFGSDRAHVWFQRTERHLVFDLISAGQAGVTHFSFRFSITQNDHNWLGIRMRIYLKCFSFLLFLLWTQIEFFMMKLRLALYVISFLFVCLFRRLPIKDRKTVT